MWSWENLREGDSAARENFAMEFGPTIARRLWKLGFQKEDAEDCAIDGIMAVFERISHFVPQEPVQQKFRAWAWTVAYHKAESWRRSYRPYLLDPLPDEFPESGVMNFQDPVEANQQKAIDDLETERRIDDLRKMVEQLPEKYRQIIENKAFGGEATFEQVGELLDIAPGTARQRYHRAIKLLQQIALQTKRSRGDS
jgi:RNA polymerase sigma factor (sigma-70 family)